MSEGTTPLERQILEHYAVFAEPFHDAIWKDIHKDIIRRFIDYGLLLGNVNEPVSVQGNSHALRPYMDALGRVQLPVQAWIVPNE